jgi:hypothetical protein
LFEQGKGGQPFYFALELVAAAAIACCNPFRFSLLAASLCFSLLSRLGAIFSRLVGGNAISMILMIDIGVMLLSIHSLLRKSYFWGLQTKEK